MQAIIYKPERIATRTGIFAQVLHVVAPKLYAVIANTAFRLFLNTRRQRPAGR